MIELPKWVNEIFSGKIGEIAGLAFYSLLVVYFMRLLGVPFERHFENFEILVKLGIGLTFPFAAKPILAWGASKFSLWLWACKKKRYLKARILKIRKYSEPKKQILLFAFMQGNNFLQLKDSPELAEMTADEVLEQYHQYYKIEHEIWNDLNARPDYRDLVLESATLAKEVKSAIDADRRHRGFY